MEKDSKKSKVAELELKLNLVIERLLEAEKQLEEQDRVLRLILVKLISEADV